MAALCRCTFLVSAAMSISDRTSLRYFQIARINRKLFAYNRLRDLFPQGKEILIPSPNPEIVVLAVSSLTDVVKERQYQTSRVSPASPENITIT